MKHLILLILVFVVAFVWIFYIIERRFEKRHGYYMFNGFFYIWIALMLAVSCSANAQDSSYEYMAYRKHILDDSIRLIKSQNAWLDSFNMSLNYLSVRADTVKWKKYYYKKKKK